jgi:hypothetical protein
MHECERVRQRMMDDRTAVSDGPFPALSEVHYAEGSTSVLRTLLSTVANKLYIRGTKIQHLRSKIWCFSACNLAASLSYLPTSSKSLEPQL